MTAERRAPLVALAGNPNTGKTSLFNRLTGANARVGNYPGITVEQEVGSWRVRGQRVDVTDVPGTYSLASRSADEQVAVRAIFGLGGNPRPDMVVAVVDATQLVRNLYFALQLVEARVPLVVALNLTDVARAQGRAPDPAHVAALLGVPVVAVSAATGEGMAELEAAVSRVLAHPDEGRGRVGWRYPAALEADLARLAPLAEASPAEARALALWTLLSVDDGDELVDVPPEVRAAVTAIRAEGRDLDAEIVGTRYAWLDGQDWKLGAAPLATTTDQLDRWLLHPVSGGLTFLFVMGTLFWVLFRGAELPMGWIEGLFGWVGEQTAAALGRGLLSDFLVGALVNGVGSVVVFLPQILLLFFLLGFLEDVGYMARVAYLVDRAMKAVGLHGRAFVPMLSGYACAVPAIMATRTLERRRDRLLTMMVVPLMSCSARLPVYSLVIVTLFAGSAPLLGIVPMDVAMMIGMYLFSTMAALLAAGVLGRTVLKGPKMPLLLELPPYRLPRLASVLRQMWLRAKSFLTEAGTIILAASAVIWGLLYFGPGEQLAPAPAEATEESYAAHLGQAIEPVIAPLGFDWKIGVGLVGAFAAREVFVATMGMVYALDGDVAEDDERLWARIAAERRPDGTPVWTPLTGLSLMVFFALSAQCLSTVAVVKRESRSWGWAAFLFGYMTALAWTASLLVYQGGRVLGLG